MALGSTAAHCTDNESLFSPDVEIEPVYFETTAPSRMVAQDEFERLHKQATRLEHLLQVMPAGVVVIDGKGIVKQANTLSRDLLGEPLEGQLWRTIIKRSFDPRKDDGHEVSLHDGRKVKLSITPLVDEPGQLIVLTDLTETRQLQQRISHMQRLSALGKTVASLVHQIRTPLSAAILYAANLASGNLKDADRTKFGLKLISRLGDLESQVNDMLLFAKSGEQQVVHEHSVVDIVEDVRSGCEAMLDSYNATLSIEDIDASENLMVNKSAVVGALQNLVHNAVQVKTDQAQIIIQCHRDEDFLVLSVSDNGPGIPAKDINSIFEPFYTTKSQGTGLGLAVVNSVAKAHGGSVSVSNLSQGGAHFAMRLPNQHKTNQRSESASSQPESHAAGG